MTEHYLYLEAVNLGNVVDDTEDLSTRRAGGYMLLELVHKVAADCTPWLKAISVGASAGLFRLLPNQGMSDARQAVAKVLRRPLYAQATVLVADTQTDDIDAEDFPLMRERLLALVRLRQMKTLAFTTDFTGEFTDQSEFAEPPHQPKFTQQTRPPLEAVCQIDEVRPAWAQVPFKQSDEFRSESVSVIERRENGRELRQRFYARELENSPGLRWANDNGFTDDFEELSGHRHFADNDITKAWIAKLPPQLDGKLAVFYVDGDGFGKIGADCETPCMLEKWDTLAQLTRRRFLLALLQLLDSHPLGKAKPIRRDGQLSPYRLRLETLMWGADEFHLVLPAWLALEAVKLFFDTCRVEWPAGTPHSHSAALVFAHHNAPIGPLKQLAKDLAEQSKTDKKAKRAEAAIRRAQLPAGDPSAATDPPLPDSLQWLVLESFDHAGGELDDYWSRRNLASLNWSQMSLDRQRLADLLLPATLAVIRRVPRRNLHRIVQLLRAKQVLDDPQQHRLLGRAYANVHEAVAGKRADWLLAWQVLQPYDGTAWPDRAEPPEPAAAHLNAWLILAELWDYLPPEAPDQAAAPPTAGSDAFQAASGHSDAAPQSMEGAR